MKKNDIIEASDKEYLKESYSSQLEHMNKRENRKILYTLLFVAVVLVAAIITPTILLKVNQTMIQYADTTNLNACGNPGGFCETFDGDPASPLPLGGIAGKSLKTRTLEHGAHSNPR